MKVPISLAGFLSVPAKVASFGLLASMLWGLSDFCAMPGDPW